MTERAEVTSCVRRFGRKPVPTPTSEPREWFEVKRSIGHSPPIVGLIPRDVVEAMGIDCSAVDRGAGLWFTREQSEAMHKHPEWEPAQ